MMIGVLSRHRDKKISFLRATLYLSKIGTYNGIVNKLHMDGIIPFTGNWVDFSSVSPWQWVSIIPSMCYFFHDSLYVTVSVTWKNPAHHLYVSNTK